MKHLVDVTGITYLLLWNCKKKKNYNTNGLNYLI